MAKPSVLFVVGTRPDAIKSAPVVRTMRTLFSEIVDVKLVSTGQHREMLTQALNAFQLAPDLDLALMKQGQGLAELTARCLTGLDAVCDQLRPDLIFAQGDTTTTFTAALTAFYRRVRFVHIEAGLRTPSVESPFPEEFNRRAAGLVTWQHFPPTQGAADNLAREGVPPESMLVTGNTGIDAVLHVAAERPQTWYPEHGGPVILLTTHRRENWGEPQRRIATAARRLLDLHPDAILAVPMHRNPVVRETLEAVLADHPRAYLMEPPDYADFVKLLERADLALTDSGGVQEEAPSFGVPVVVLREDTERPEGVQAGSAVLAGTNEEVIIRYANDLLHRPRQSRSPYGDGKASERICRRVLHRLGLVEEDATAWA